MGQHTERVYYIADTSYGVTTYCGKCVNYPSVNATGVALKELENSIIEQLEIERDLLSEIIELPGSLEMVEKDNEDDWLHSDINTAHWEIERLKYLLSKEGEYKTTISRIIEGTIANMTDKQIALTASHEIAEIIIKAITEYENK